MPQPRNTFTPHSARQLVALGLAPLFKSDADASKPFPLTVVDREVNGHRMFTMAVENQAVIVFGPRHKVFALHKLLGDEFLLQKILQSPEVDASLGLAVARISFTPGALKKQGRLEVTAWHSSARTINTLRSLRGVLPPGMSVTYAKPVLEAA